MGRPTRLIAGLMTASAGIAYSAISLFRDSRFGSTRDLATQAQTVWGYSRFEFIPNTVIGIPNLLGDHFHPILMSLAPFFWVWDSASVLLVAQAVLLAAAGVPIFLWGKERLGEVAGLAFLGAFYLYWGILAGVLFDFHHVVFAVAAISWALYATVTRRNRLLIAMVGIAMLTREDVALTVVALGLYIVVVQRRLVLGAVLMVTNTIWFGLLVGAIMPAISQQPYRHWFYSGLGTGPLSALLHIVRHPIQSIELLFMPATKLRVWAASFGNWLFLPLLSPITLVAAPTFLERFWNDGPDLWNFHMQYSMPAAPILAFAAIDGAARLTPLVHGRGPAWFGTRAAIAVLAASAILSVAINPLAELGTYVSSATAADIQSCLNVIPPAAGVAATQNLLPHLATRMHAYQIPIQNTNGPPVDPVAAGVEYIAIDIGTEGNGATFRGVVQEAFAAEYGVACSKELTVVLSRAASGRAMTPQLERWLAGDCEGRGCL